VRVAWKAEEETNVAVIMKYYNLQCEELQRREGKKE
jgi:hypothetical protein